MRDDDHLYNYDPHDATQPDRFDLDLASIAPESLDEEAGQALTVAASLDAQTIKDLIHNRNFVPLWIGQLISYTGDQFSLIAALAVIGPLSQGNAIATGLFAISLAVPQILFGLFSGVLVDKLDRKLTMILSDVIRSLAVFSLLLVQHDPQRLWIFYPAIFVLGTAQTMFDPARASSLPSIVKKRNLAAANALLETGFVVALILGAGTAGILVEHFGENVAFAFDGFSYLFSAFMISRIIVPIRKSIPTTESQGSRIRQILWELRQGLAYLWHTTSMRYIMGLSVMVAAGLGSVIILVLDYLNKTLNIGASGFGAVVGILGIGIVIGGILIQRLSRFLPTNRLVALAMLLDGIAVGAFVLHPPFSVVLFLTGVIGFSVIVARAVLGTLIQSIPPEEFRGRVQSAFNIIFSGPLTLSIGLAGVLLQAFSRRYSFAPDGLNGIPSAIALYNTVTNQEIVFGGFAVALILTAWLTVNLLRGIDEAVYSDA